LYPDTILNDSIKGQDESFLLHSYLSYHVYIAVGLLWSVKV